MKPGDLVEFKAGLFGIQAPNNVGLYLERLKKKEGFYAVLYTAKGRLEVKTEHLKGRLLASQLTLPADEATLKSRLAQLLADRSKKAAQVEVRPGEVRDADLWRKVSGTEGPYTAYALAAALFGTEQPSTDQREAVRRALESCRRAGVGYFRLAGARDETWKPIEVETFKTFRREADAFRALRKRLIAEEEVEDDPNAPPRTVYVGLAFSLDALPPEDAERVRVLAKVMEDFVLHDRDRGAVTVPGTDRHTLDGFSLFDFARWLANDWTGSRASLSSTFVEFLVDAGLRTEAQALELVARRLVQAREGFGWDSPPEVEEAANRFPGDLPAPWLSGRRDLRGVPCYTIDPADARDFDDAVGYERQPDGTHVLWVHIADVSHYVEKNSAIDLSARTRGTSVYLPVRVLPMLPSRLSDDLCSLRDASDRLSMSVRTRYDADGGVLEEELFEGVIRVTRNCRYEEVDEAIAAGREPFASMEAFARVLQSRRRGLSLDTGERRIRLTEGGIVDPTIKEGSPATRMIEAFMVAANEAVARRLTREGVFLPYRCHPLPDRASVETWNAQMETLGISLRIELPEPADSEPEAGSGASLLDLLQKGGKLELVTGGFKPEATDGEETGPPAPAVRGVAQLSDEEREVYLRPFREALSVVSALPDPRVREIVHVKLLSAMGRAFYTPRNLGHFGLGSDCYCHFTSPIRRYPDLIVHRALRWVLRGRPGAEPHTLDEHEAMSAHDSEQGQAAEALERGTVNSAMVFASRDPRYAGALEGVVNGVTRGGLFLALPGGLEARLSTADLPGGPFAVDEHASVLYAGEIEREALQGEVDASNWRELLDPQTGELRRVRAKLGDRLRVTIAHRDYVAGRVGVKLAD